MTIDHHNQFVVDKEVAMTVKMQDGVEVDTAGPMRKITIKEQLYVVGHSMCLPVADETEADALIEKFKRPAE